MNYDTLRRHVRELQKFDWAYEFPDPKTRRPIVVPSMPAGVEESMSKQWLLHRTVTAFQGQWLTGRWLDLLVDDFDYVPDARPEFLVSGFGSRRLEIDFFYRRARVAIEFQGRHHFEAGPSAKDQEQLRQQQERDALKALLCARQDIAFVEISGEDLTYETLVNKLGHLLPLIPPRKERPLFRLLTDMSHSYINYLRR